MSSAPATTQVPTTAGPVEVTQLGRTMGHEHLRVGSEGMRTQFPHLYDAERDLRECIEKITEVMQYGVRTICDPACMDLNRDVHLNIAVTEATGMRFVMATGIYGAHWSALPVFLRDKTDLIVESFLHDLRVGIQGTDVRAAFIKCAADHPGLTPDIEMVHRAAARAALEAGVPVMAHSHPDSGIAFEQLRVFSEEGLSAERVQVAHTGDTDDLDYIERLLDTGCFIGMDRYGLNLETKSRNDTIVELVRRGYSGRMIIGHDSSVVMDGRTEQALRERYRDNRLTFIFESVFPALEQAGLSADEIEALVGAAVHGWLTGGHTR